MSVLIRSKKWGYQKPPPGAQINSGHPLAAGLASVSLFSEGGGAGSRDIITSQQGNLNGQWVWFPAGQAGFNGPGPFGPLIREPLANFYYTVGNPPLLLNNPKNEISVVMAINQNSAINSGILAAQDGNQRCWTLDTNSPNLRFYINGGGTALVQTGAFALDAWAIVGGTWNPVSGALSVYVNGIQKATGTFGGITMATPSTTPLTLGGRTLGGNVNPIIAEIAFCYVWARELKPNDMMDLYMDPYGIFMPQSGNRRLRVIPAPPPPVGSGSSQRFGKTRVWQGNEFEAVLT